MNQKGFINILLLALVIILAGVVGYLTLVKKPAQPIAIQTPTSISTPTATPIFQGQLYENQYMKITIPAGWTVTQATETVYVKDVLQKHPNPAAVNITKNNYILYINTQAQQASGIAGGRFSEIAQGAPSADAVIQIHPSSPCGFSETNPGFPDHPRVDLYVDSRSNRELCAHPSTKATVWYFSYITDRSGSYFNYYKEGEPLSFVITMAYNSKDVNKLPVKGSAELNTMLNEMTAIINTLEIKQK